MGTESINWGTLITEKIFFSSHLKSFYKMCWKCVDGNSLEGRYKQQNGALFQNHSFEIRTHGCISEGVLPFSQKYFYKNSFICPDEMASVSVCLSLFKKPQIFTSIKLVFLGSLDWRAGTMCNSVWKNLNDICLLYFCVFTYLRTVIRWVISGQC